MGKILKTHIITKYIALLTILLMTISLLSLPNLNLKYANASVVTWPSTLTTQQQKADCYSSYKDDTSHGYGTPPSNPDVTKIQLAGKTWGIIGSNNTGSQISGIPTGKKGIAGPNNTVTILLDEDSYDSSLRTRFDIISPSSNEYSTSDLKETMNDIYDELTDEQKSSIVNRNLTGNSSTSASTEGYNGDTIAGDQVDNQGFWPLSTKEASSLKTSVRTFGNNWWLRSPGNFSYYAAFVISYGNVYGDGYNVGSNNSARPASFLNLRS